MYYFFLGNTPDLSRLELLSVLPEEPTLISDTILSYSAQLDLPSLGPRLGGIKKIAQQLTVCSSREVIPELTKLMIASSNKNMAITDYASLTLTHADLIQLKKSVQPVRPIRLVSTDTGEHELLMLSHQHVTEFNLLPDPRGVAIAQTEFIFDAEDWISRDRAKTYRDIKRGMLPPKLARIMVNLATRGQVGLTLADPFCGTGTILAEALLAGCSSVYGSDNNGRAVTGSTANLEWLTSHYHLSPGNSQLFLLDATHLHEQLKQVDVIVTEPYMGPLVNEVQTTTADKIKDLARGLDKLYRGSFRSWSQILPKGGRVVITLPSFRHENHEIKTISVDTITSLGYNYISAVPYGKPGATVIRNITILEKN
ncbi:MAG: hypothetical protein UX63_C0019G0009 [Microgenomates group bacterium GW2011_GWB1_46_7]|nr:MAG: hypothetical protein UX63_C0019G0009 [Microgenomates group bacterium GW2011_GWB1_46_7]